MTNKVACKAFPASFTITLPIVSDETSDEVSYNIVTPPSYGVLSGCLNGTDSVTCTYTWGAGLPADPDDTIEYNVNDEAGNNSATTQILINSIICA